VELDRCELFDTVMIRSASTDLDFLLQMASSSLPFILKVPELLRLYQAESELLMSFLKSHVRELLETAMEDSRARATLVAHRLLAIGKLRMIPPLLESGRFGEFAVRLLASPGPAPSASVVGRLCAITLTVMASGEPAYFEHCRFVFQLLRFADNCSVVDLFASMSVNVPATEKLHRWLVDARYPEVLAHELADLGEANELRILGLMRLVAAAVDSPILRAAIGSPPVIETLVAPGDHSWLVENGRWQAVCALCNADTYKRFLNFAVRARQTLRRAGDRVHDFHASALCFLTKLIRMRGDLFDEEFVRCVLGLVLQFPANSILQANVKNFVVASLGIDVIMRRVLRLFLPILLVECGIREHGVLPMFAFATLEEIAKVAASNPAVEKVVTIVDGFQTFRLTTLKRVISVRDAEYGGSLPGPSIFVL
jgi:hypothetical protein